MLSDEECRRFEKDGYLGPFTLPPEAFAAFEGHFQERVCRLLLGPAEAKPPRYFIRNQHVSSRMVYQLATLNPIMARVRKLLGNDFLVWTAHVVARRPGAGGQSWHSDAINNLVKGIHVSVALTEMKQKNGCLRLVPGSHRLRASLTNRPRIDGRADPRDLADELAPWNAPHEVVEMELEPGQFVLTTGGLWHGIPANETDAPRLAAVLRYARTDTCCRAYGYDDACPKEGPKLPCVLVSGEDRFALNRLEPPPVSDIFFDQAHKLPRVGVVGRIRRRVVELMRSMLRQ